MSQDMWEALDCSSRDRQRFRVLLCGEDTYLYLRYKPRVWSAEIRSAGRRMAVLPLNTSTNYIDDMKLEARNAAVQWLTGALSSLGVTPDAETTELHKTIEEQRRRIQLDANMLASAKDALEQSKLKLREKAKVWNQKSVEAIGGRDKTIAELKRELGMYQARLRDAQVKTIKLDHPKSGSAAKWRKRAKKWKARAKAADWRKVGDYVAEIARLREDAEIVEGLNRILTKASDGGLWEKKQLLTGVAAWVDGARSMRQFATRISETLEIMP